MNRLIRYERQLERSLAEATRELDKLQYAELLGCSFFYVSNLKKFSHQRMTRHALRRDN